MNRLHRSLRVAVTFLAMSVTVASAQTVISDSFTDTIATNTLWSKNLSVIPDNGYTPSLVQSTGAGTLTFTYRPTLFSNVDLPADHQGSLAFRFGPGGGDLLSVGLRGSSTRDSGNYGSFYGLVLEFHQYINQLRVVSYTSSGAATVLGSYAFNFSSGFTYDFSWVLDGTSLVVTQAGGSSYNFTGMTAGGGNKIFLNNGQDRANLILYNVSVSAIPEPATVASLAGVFALVAAVYRRRLRKPEGLSPKIG